MKYTAVLLVAALVCGAVVEANEPPRQDPRGYLLSGRFNVSVDHFRPQSTEETTFEYEYNIDYFDVGGPLFIYVNDADTYTTEWIQRGLMYDLARELGGALITANMRYFRFNLPTQTVDFNDLSLLSVEQSLADLVTLVDAARTELRTNASSQAYVWGSGWGGTLAVLARQKYPSIFAAAWSSSGLFEPNVFDTSNYDILSSLVFEHGGNACGMSVHHAFHGLEHALMHGNEGRIVRDFGLCRPWNVSNAMDRAMFSEGLLHQLIDYVNAKHYTGVQNLCEALDAIPADPMASLGRWVRFTYLADFGHCFNYDYAGRQIWLADTQFHNPGTASGKRQFLYLQCMQLGQLRVSQEDGLFGHHITADYRRRMCEDAFGEAYDFEQLAVNVERFRTHYGGKNPHATRVLFTNGELDTELGNGITQYTAPQSHAITILGYGKSGDLLSISVHDSTVMFAAKTRIQEIIRGWVQGVAN